MYANKQHIFNFSGNRCIKNAGRSFELGSAFVPPLTTFAVDFLRCSLPPH